MKPVIGITSSIAKDESWHRVTDLNVKAITEAGGVPAILPNISEVKMIQQMADIIDGLLGTGGYDIDPLLYGEEPHQKLGTVTPARDHFEEIIFKEMLQRNKPILAICRGMQMLNVVAGGDMYQDIYAQIDQPNMLQHSQQAPYQYGVHFVHIEKNSLLFQMTETEKIKVNSNHHQAVRNVPSSFKISGKTSDGIIEAIESKEHYFVLGLQWHPEHMASAGDQVSKKIFRSFLQACQI